MPSCSDQSDSNFPDIVITISQLLNTNFTGEVERTISICCGCAKLTARVSGENVWQSLSNCMLINDLWDATIMNLIILIIQLQALLCCFVFIHVLFFKGNFGLSDGRFFVMGDDFNCIYIYIYI